MTRLDDIPLSPDDIQRFGSDLLSSFRVNFAAVEDRIARACARVSQDRAAVRLLPVTKTVGPYSAACLGISDFGENKL